MVDEIESFAQADDEARQDKAEEWYSSLEDIFAWDSAKSLSVGAAIAVATLAISI